MGHQSLLSLEKIKHLTKLKEFWFIECKLKVGSFGEKCVLKNLLKLGNSSIYKKLICSKKKLIQLDKTKSHDIFFLFSNLTFHHPRTGDQRSTTPTEPTEGGAIQQPYWRNKKPQQTHQPHLSQPQRQQHQMYQGCNLQTSFISPDG